MSSVKEINGQLEDYVWGRIDDKEYLKNVGMNVDLRDTELLSKVETMQESLNKQLRKRVDENYPMLLEQANAIEVLDEMQEQYHKVMTEIHQKTNKMNDLVENHRKNMSKGIVLLENTQKLRRILNDGLRCEKLIDEASKETDVLKLSEIICEVEAINKENGDLKKVIWMNEGFLYKIPQLIRDAKQKVVKELKSALDSINAAGVNNCLKALDYLECSKSELTKIYEETAVQLDSFFLKLSVNCTSTEKLSKFLPVFSTKLNTVLEQFALLGNEHINSLSKRISQIIVNRIPNNSTNSMRIVQTLSKALSAHNEIHIKPIKDALAPLKASILTQSLNNLFKKIDEVFAEEDIAYELMVEMINSEIKIELNSVDWDHSLQKEMEHNVSKALNYIAVKIENMLNLGQDQLHLTGRVDKTQLKNYEMIHVAHLIAEQWRAIAQPLIQLVDGSLSAISSNIKDLLTLVICSMHEENMTKPLKGSSCSGYIRELRDHLKVFKTHVDHMKSLVETNTILSNFIDFIIQKLLVHFSLIRPSSKSLHERISMDLISLCEKGLSPLNCRASVLLRDYQSIASYLKSGDYAKSVKTGPLTLPYWIHLHLIISESNGIPLPNEFKKMDYKDYIDWFFTLNAKEKHAFMTDYIHHNNEKENLNVAECLIVLSNAKISK
uniref:Conserved oligomeric Golgi complex subunit 5 n=1 Tax=Rhabditophanes sp. KR3021 TaxID=114890 RepID=A0AC35TQR7_9BILA